jgi:hypothetical protein
MAPSVKAGSRSVVVDVLVVGALGGAWVTEVVEIGDVVETGTVL